MTKALRRSLAASLAPLMTLGMAPGFVLAGPSPVEEAQHREAMALFESRVRPVLVERCQRCHGEERQKGDLRLDSRAAMLAGGGFGPAVVPGSTAESLIVEAVRYEGLEMPPEGPLAEEEVEAIARWVELGAPWPGQEHAEVVRDEPGSFSRDDREYWAFQPVGRFEPPAVEDGGWSRNPIDRFVSDRLGRAGLRPAPEADKRTLIRRATFDLHGLPPTPEEVDAFLADESPEAFDRLVDRLLESPRYGERWGRHWLDLVRFAESNGYRADEFRPFAWRYRDYVIDALNRDLPYDEFVRQQIAGDELYPERPIGRVATGYLRLWVYESNQRDVQGQWDGILDDITDVTADAFLGLGMGCAKCHDHKYDPILQRDYYRLRSYFAAVIPLDDATVRPPAPGTGAAERRASWEALTADLRAEIGEIERRYREQAERDAVTKFQPEMQTLLAAREASAGDLSPRETQLATLAFRQVAMEYDKVPSKLEDEKLRWERLVAELGRFDAIRPDDPDVEAIGDVSAEAPPTVIPGDRGAEEIEPGILSILDPAPDAINPPRGWPSSTGRRTALAAWLTDTSNPLVPRVMVNRLWQGHFGRGIVPTTSDFGRLGEAPSHPELLDWLATTLIEEGWSLKSIHRLMMTSATYRQASSREDLTACKAIDPDNALLWMMPSHRLEAEPIWDAMLAVSGELDPEMGGPSVTPEAPRRAVYTRFLRNTKDPLLGAFDVADGYLSTAQRNVTTAPTQSLLMINGSWTLDRARAFTDRLFEDATLDAEARVGLAFRLAFARPPAREEVTAALAFVGGRDAGDRLAAAPPCGDEVGVGTGLPEAERTAWVDFCHVLLNASEFLYVD
ncbi:PSD1 and planctomycete cytochrome C domain-containing protein [Tautonia plasticadhaerens]|uniref:Planctomycete cytochrome C n=1 Tax=Tautonia plasticadhaerens TaxID=2527974 RepID=A0A518H6Q9_9BACT|nr:PSD1 and planctomycete cytochrome C domain-containing protein [Tautonia plasticadhaerens]QDV36541.1 Planctomycete cytochrome C [Tautonia plasticadhaerens]